MKRAVPVSLLIMVSAAAAIGFQGTVLDAYTRQPVSFAEVRVHGTDAPVQTDEQGRFAVPAAPPVSVTVSRIGYETKTWYNLDPAESETRSWRAPASLYLLPQAIDLEGVTVSAHRSPVPVEQSGPVAILEPGSPGQDGVTDLAQAVRSSASLFSRDNTNFTSILLRGTNTGHTLVALDGVRLNSAQNGTFDMTSLPLILARRIEVCRSGSSALYGTSPLGGLVNVITPEAEQPGTDLKTGLGSFGKKHVELTHAAWFDPLGLALAGSFTRADNNFPFQDSTGAHRLMTNADFESKGLMAKAGFRTGSHRASLLGEYNITERGVPGPRTMPGDSARRNDLRGLAQLNYRFQPDERTRTDVRLYYHRFWQNYRDPMAFTPADDTHELSNLGIQTDQSLYLIPWVMAMAGLDVSKESLTSTAVGSPARTTVAGWAQVRLERSGFSLNPAVRYERLSQQLRTDSAETKSTLGIFSPKFTLTWPGIGWFSLYTGIGRSFRAPTFNDLYWPEDPYSYGNPGLRPEWSTNVDFGIAGTKPGFLHYWAGCYYSVLTDLIQWQPDTAFRYRPVNVDSATITGIELVAELDLDYLGLSADMNLSRANTGDQRLFYRPEFIGHATVWAQREFTPVTLRLNLTAEHTGNRLTDPVFPDTVPEVMPAYSLFHAEASAGTSVGPLSPTVRLGVRNLLDQRYETVKAYPVPGRTCYAQLEVGI